MTSYQDKLASQLDDLVSCPICAKCLENFKDSGSLPRLNTVCQGCLLGFALAKMQETGQFPSPLSHDRTRLPLREAVNFPANFMLSSLEDTLSKEDKKETGKDRSWTRALTDRSSLQRCVSRDCDSESTITVGLSETYVCKDMLIKENQEIGSVGDILERNIFHTEPVDHPGQVILTEKRNFKLEGVELNGIASCGNKIAFLDSSTNEILICNETGDILYKFGQRQNDKHKLTSTGDIAALGESKVAVTDPATKRIHVYDTTKEHARGVSIQRRQTIGVNGLSVNTMGEAIVTDCDNEALYIYEAKEEAIGLKHKHKVRPGHYSTFKFKCPGYVTVNPVNDDIVVSDTGLNKLIVLTKCGEYRFQYGQNDAASCNDEFKAGRSCCDREGRIFLIDGGNNSIHVLSRDGHFVTSISLEGFEHPTLIDINMEGQLVLANCTGLVKVFAYSFISTSDCVYSR